MQRQVAAALPVLLAAIVGTPLPPSCGHAAVRQRLADAITLAAKRHLVDAGASPQWRLSFRSDVTHSLDQLDCAGCSECQSALAAIKVSLPAKLDHASAAVQSFICAATWRLFDSLTDQMRCAVNTERPLVCEPSVERATFDASAHVCQSSRHTA